MTMVLVTFAETKVTNNIGCSLTDKVQTPTQ